MTPVGLCNLALSHLGHQVTVSAIDPPEDSYEAQMCAMFFPQARDSALEMGYWSFATKRASLSALTNPSDRWAYAYAHPADCLKPYAILLPETAATLPVLWTDQEFRSWICNPDMLRFDFIVEALSNGTKAIFTNVENAILLYTYQCKDTTKFTSLFTLGMSYLLASMLAGPLTKDPRIQGAMLQAAQATIGNASVSDANARQFNPYDVLPAAVRARC